MRMLNQFSQCHQFVRKLDVKVCKMQQNRQACETVYRFPGLLASVYQGG